MESILELFNICNIKYIVSVDDCYKKVTSSVVDSEIVDDILEDTEKYITKIKQVNIVEEIEKNLELPPEIRRKEITKMVENLALEDKSEVIRLCDDNFSLYTERDQLLEFFELLKEKNCINEFICFENIADAKGFFDNDIKTMWTTDEENKVLWLIDRDLGQTGREDDGFKFLQYFCNKSTNCNIGVLATNQLNEIKDEEEFDKYLDQIKLENKNSIWRMEKGKINIRRKNDFLKEVSYGLRRNATYKITNYLANTYRDNIDNASSKIKRLKQSTINNVIFGFSNNEGIASIDTLYRILLIITKGYLDEDISKHHKKISNLIWNYERLCNFHQESEINDFREINNIRRIEKYNFFINKSLSPINYGDIFRVRDKEYILISQPCDISLKYDGRRKNNDVVKSGLLVRISKSKPDYKDYGKLEYYDQLASYYVHFKESIFVDFDILDLCTINEDGQAKVSFNILEKNQFDEDKYFKGHRERLRKIIEKVRMIFKSYIEKEDKLDKIKELIKNYDKGCQEIALHLLDEYNKDTIQFINKGLNLENINIDKEYVTYDVQRVCRLDDLYTINVATKYYNVNSRLGLPGDFAEKYRYRTYTIKFQNPETVIDNSENHYLEEFEREIDIATEEDIKIIIYNDILKPLTNNGFDKELSKFSDIKKRTEATYKYVDQYAVIKDKESTIIIKVDILNIYENTTNAKIDFKSDFLKIPIEVIKNEAEIFYKEIESHIGDNEFCIDNPCMRRFYKQDNKVINNHIIFKKNEIKEKEIILPLKDKVNLKVTLSLLKKENIDFELTIKCKEDQS